MTAPTTNTKTCEARTYPETGAWRYFHPAKCERPAKGERTDGGDPFPVCGIHLLQRRVVRFTPQ